MLQGNIEDKGNVHALRYEIYKKYKEYLIKREFWLEVTHTIGGKKFWTFVEDNIINENK